MEDHLDMAPFVGGYSASSGGASHLGHYAPSSSSHSSNGNHNNNNGLSQHHQQQQQHSYHASSPSASSSYLPSSDFVADSLHILSSLSHQQEICNSSISLHNLHSLASSSCSPSSRLLPSSAAAAAAAASSSSTSSSSSSNVGSGSAASSPSSPLSNDPSSPPVQTTTPKKRGRKRKYGDTSDPEELKKQLRARDQEISRLKRRIQQLETLLQQLQSSSAASFANSSSSASSSSDASSSSSSSASLSNHNNSGDVFGIYVNRNPDQVEKEVRNVLLSVKQQVTSQMVYRSSLKHAHSRISAQVPRVSAQAVDVIFQELNPKSKGPKLIKWACSATDLANIFGIYGKSLRYGASLEVVGQSNVTWQREDGDLSIKGKFTMVRG